MTQELESKESHRSCASQGEVRNVGMRASCAVLSAPRSYPYAVGGYTCVTLFRVLGYVQSGDMARA